MYQHIFCDICGKVTEHYLGQCGDCQEKEIAEYEEQLCLYKENPYEDA